MSYHYSATGERIEDVDSALSVANVPDERHAAVNGRDAEIVALCNELRRILREGRRARQVQP